MLEPTQIFKSTIVVSSDVGYSRERATYRIGRPDTPINTSYGVSEREVIEIMENLPKELLDHVIAFYKLGEPQTFDPANLTEEELEQVKVHYQLIEMEAVAKGLEGSIEQLEAQKDEESAKIAENDGLNHDTIEAETEQSKENTEEGSENEEDSGIDIMELGVRELKPIAKDLGIEGYSNMNKEQLQKAITEAVGEEA